jgi:broad specificity phosphatase PhoE
VKCAAELVLVRHADVDCTSSGVPLLCGWHDAPLSSSGHKQLELLRLRLAAEPGFAGLYASPLQRAFYTASAAPGYLLPHLRLLNSLKEIHCGVVEGLSFERVQAEYGDYWQRNLLQTDENFRWPGGETYRRFRTRVLRAISAISRQHQGQRVLIVTHAGVVNQVLGTISGQSAARWENLRPKNASLTTVRWDDCSGEVENFDDCEHLLAEQLAG